MIIVDLSTCVDYGVSINIHKITTVQRMFASIILAIIHKSNMENSIHFNDHAPIDCTITYIV